MGVCPHCGRSISEGTAVCPDCGADLRTATDPITTPSCGWFQDPLDHTQFRWWDGAKWTHAIAWIKGSGQEGDQRVEFDLDSVPGLSLEVADKVFTNEQPWAVPTQTAAPGSSRPDPRVLYDGPLFWFWLGPMPKNSQSFIWYIIGFNTPAAFWVWYHYSDDFPDEAHKIAVGAVSSIGFYLLILLVVLVARVFIH